MNCYSDISFFFFFDDRRSYLLFIIGILRKIKKKMENEVSCMEKECLIERRRATTLEECSHIIGLNGVARYNREAFKQLLQDSVNIFVFNNQINRRGIYLLQFLFLSINAN